MTGTHVQVLAGEEVVSLRVRAVTEGEFVVAGGDEVVLGVGDRLEVAWSSPLALFRSSAEVVADTGPGQWRLRLVGPGERMQRRQSVRIPVQLPVRLRSWGHLVEGLTLDLGEGGLRCRAEVALAPNDRVAVAFQLDDVAVLADADVVRVSATDGGQHVVALRFVSPYPSEFIRRWVFDEQLRRRRRS